MNTSVTGHRQIQSFTAEKKTDRHAAIQSSGLFLFSKNIKSSLLGTYVRNWAQGPLITSFAALKNVSFVVHELTSLKSFTKWQKIIAGKEASYLGYQNVCKDSKEKIFY